MEHLICQQALEAAATAVMEAAAAVEAEEVGEVAGRVAANLTA